MDVTQALTNSRRSTPSDMRARNLTSVFMQLCIDASAPTPDSAIACTSGDPRPSVASSFAFSRDIALSLPAIGGPLVDQHEHAVADDLRLLQPQVASLGLLLEGLLARPEDHREDHQVDLVDEVALDQLLHQPVAPRHLQLAVELL